MSNKVSYIIELQDKFSRTADAMSRKLGKVNSKVKRVTRNMFQLSEKSKAASLVMVRGLRNMAVAAGIAGGFIVRQSVNMEDAMADVARVTGATGDDLNAFEEKLELISEALGKSKRGLAEMAFEGGKLGVALDNMEPFLEVVSKTAVAFDMVDSEAGRSIGSIRAKMNLMNEDTVKLLDSVNFLADNTSASGSRMINILERVSGTMSILKVDPIAAASLTGFADQIEVTSELASSGINMFFSRLQRVPGMTTKLLANPLETVRNELELMAKMDPEQQATFIRKSFGEESGRFVKKMVSNVELFNKTVGIAFDPKSVGSMQREMQNQLDRSSSAFKRLKETALNTIDTIGDQLKPAATEAARSLTSLIDAIGEIVKAPEKLNKSGLGKVFLEIAGDFKKATTIIFDNSGILTGVLKGIGNTAEIILKIIRSVGSVIGQTIGAIRTLDFSSFDFGGIRSDFSTGFFDKLGKAVAFSPTAAAVSAPGVQQAGRGRGSVQGEIVVRAEPGTEVKQTLMRSRGRGMDIGLNMVQAQ